MIVSVTLLLLPNPTSYPEFQLLPIASGEEKGHVTLDDKTVETVPDLPVTVPNTPWHSLPNHLPPISPNLKTVTVVLRLIIVAHKPQERYVHWRHAELESFEM